MRPAPTRCARWWTAAPFRWSPTSILITSSPSRRWKTASKAAHQPRQHRRREERAYPGGLRQGASYPGAHRRELRLERRISSPNMAGRPRRAWWKRAGARKNAGKLRLLRHGALHEGEQRAGYRRGVSAGQRECDYPLHLGVTEAGLPEGGKSRAQSASARCCWMASATIRVSLTGDPCLEPPVGIEIFRTSACAKDFVQYVSCPTCGRTCIDVGGIMRRVQQELKGVNVPFKVAVMGCVVNGPGEGRRRISASAAAETAWVC